MNGKIGLEDRFGQHPKQNEFVSDDDDGDDYTDGSDGKDDDDLLVVSLGGIASYQTHSTISLAMEIGP